MGYAYDAESGLIYLRARYYDPSTGQFISRDPAVASTREPYAYVGDNPLNATHDGEVKRIRLINRSLNDQGPGEPGPWSAGCGVS